MSPTKETGTWWCNAHGREATEVWPDGTHHCARRLGGIMIPCMTVFAPMVVVRPKCRKARR